MLKPIAFAAALALAATAQAGTEVSTVISGIEASGGVALGPDGHVYVGDFGATLQTAGGANVYRIAPGGGGIEILNAEFGGASGNAFGPEGELYQSDVGRGEAWRIGSDGARTRIAEGMASPVGIAPLAGGSAYVTNCVSDRILRIRTDGTTRTIAEGPPLDCPNGLAFGGDGALYTVNFRNGSVVRIALPSGEMSVLADIPGGGNGHLTWANDRFYIASFRGGRIYSLTLEGERCLIAGSGARGNADGSGEEASLFRPNGVAVSADGDTLFTNTVLAIVAPDSPQLHPNALRRVDGLLSMLDCPEDRIVGGG